MAAVAADHPAEAPGRASPAGIEQLGRKFRQPGEDALSAGVAGSGARGSQLGVAGAAFGTGNAWRVAHGEPPVRDGRTGMASAGCRMRGIGSCRSEGRRARALRKTKASFHRRLALPTPSVPLTSALAMLGRR